jgi:hypothetical protein
MSNGTGMIITAIISLQNVVELKALDGSVYYWKPDYPVSRLKVGDIIWVNK